jgi:hypothetical protein
MKMTVFWDVAPCSLVDFTDVSDVLAASIITHRPDRLWEIGFRDVDWIHWAQDRDRWRDLVNTVMNLRVP